MTIISDHVIVTILTPCLLPLSQHVPTDPARFVSLSLLDPALNPVVKQLALGLG